jgi:hypothetical protein
VAGDQGNGNEKSPSTLGPERRARSFDERKTLMDYAHERWVERLAKFKTPYRTPQELLARRNELSLRVIQGGRLPRSRNITATINPDNKT